MNLPPASIAGARSGAMPRAVTCINRRAAPGVDRLVEQADLLGVAVEAGPLGVRLIDAGIDAPGSTEAGLRIAQICLGGLGRVGLQALPREGWPAWLQVDSAQPVVACLGSQYAGWSLAASKEETGGRRFFSLGSGPARALAAKEALYAELGWRDEDRSRGGVLVLEVDRRPPEVIVRRLLRDCGLEGPELTLILTPTASRAGTAQVVARVLEVALHRAHELKFPLADVLEGSACAPLPAPAGDAIEAMGRTNDAILYGGQVRLVVGGAVEAAEALARALPSAGSRDFGRPFAEIFRAADFDFYRIDPALFAPAEVWVSHPASGRTFHAGALRMDLLHAAWGG